MSRYMVAVIACLLLTGCVRTVYVRAPEPKYKVLRVIDGDTVVLDFNGDGLEQKTEHVRLDGFDAPEIRGVDEAEKARGLAAKAHLESLVLGRRVRYEFVGCGFYGRPLATLWLGERNINSEMIECLTNQSR